MTSVGYPHNEPLLSLNPIALLLLFSHHDRTPTFVQISIPVIVLYVLYVVTFAYPFEVSWMSTPDGLRRHLIGYGGRLFCSESTDTSTIAHTPSACCSQYHKKYISHVGTSGDSTCNSVYISCKALFQLFVTPVDSTSTDTSFSNNFYLKLTFAAMLPPFT